MYRHFIIKATLVLLVLLFSKAQLYSQCLDSSFIFHFPATANGITITENYIGTNQTYPYDTLSTCNVLSGTYFIGYSNSPSPFIQTLIFSHPVNNIIYIVVGSDSSSYAVESFSFTVNTGLLSCTQNGGCLYSQQGNLFSANSSLSYNGHGNGTYITLNSTIPYDTIKVYGTGGNNGSFMSLCANSINTSGIKETENKQQNINLYPNPSTGKLYISNFEVNQKNASIEITDVTGKLIMKQQSVISNNTVELNLEADNGVYFVKIISDKGIIQVQKVLIVK